MHSGANTTAALLLSATDNISNWSFRSVLVSDNATMQRALESSTSGYCVAPTTVKAPILYSNTVGQSTPTGPPALPPFPCSRPFTGDDVTCSSPWLTIRQRMPPIEGHAARTASGDDDSSCPPTDVDVFYGSPPATDSTTLSGSQHSVRPTVQSSASADALLLQNMHCAADKSFIM